MNYYNDNDPFIIKWLNYLIDQKLIPYGIVDDRDIREIKAKDLKEFVQCHFFAGIAGWPYALQLAGWPRNGEVWTGSCPCQPFSNAGRGGGFEDERHLWPAFRWLIAQCRPAVVFGEQVASKLGRQWLSGVRSDLETLGYAVGAADLCAADVGAPHIRQRLFWVADSDGKRWRGVQGYREGDTVRHGATRERAKGFRAHDNRLADSLSAGRATRRPTSGYGQTSGSGIDSNRLGNSGCKGSQERERVHSIPGGSDGTNPWQAFKLASCADGKRRRIPAESAFFPLANGLSPDRVGLLRSTGNAIVPQSAAEFIKSYLG